MRTRCRSTATSASRTFTRARAAVSPSLGGLDTLAPWVRTVPAPDVYRVDTTGYDGLGEWFAAQVAAAIDDLRSAGIRFAAFIADSIFSSDGVYPDPAGFLAPARRVVAQAGGLWIADEVQPGFGRTGEAMWGFARHDGDEPFVPDLVVMGKPMGNGMPVAAAAMTHDVVEAFGRDQRYFNTFGGNAMAIAAAQAVLDVIHQDRLQEGAARVGAAMRSDLSAL